MSDIFSFNDNNEDFETPAQQNEHVQTREEYWSKKNERRQQLNNEYQQDLEAYSVNISQEDYNVIKDAIANADVPEDEAYRWACAMELNKQYGMPVSYGYQNLEQINAALWGDRFTFTPKTNFKAIVDSGKLGANTLKMGRLGSKIMKAEMFGKTDYTNLLTGKPENLDEMKARYAALEQESVSLQDYEDRNFAIEALKFAAQSAPFTGYVAGVGLLGGLLSGGVGTAAAFTASMDNAAGLEYMRLRQAGSDVGDAAGFALLSGGLQALVETSLGNVAGALGRSSLGDLASQAVKNKITGNVFKRLAYDGTFKNLALRMSKEWLKENAEEGLEEVIQDLIEKGTDALAAELGGYDIDPITAKQVASDAWENFKGGAMGSLVLGLGPSMIKSKADIKEFVNVRKLAEAVPSQEAFNEYTDNSTLWEGMSDAEKKEAQKTTWENAQARVEAATTAEAQKIAEGRDAAEGAEAAAVENEDGTVEAQPVARDEFGKLNVDDETYKDSDGNITGGVYWAGDPNKSGAEGNRYGYIKYSQDKDGNITIDNFKMTEGREGLREELFNQFAREHPDVKIDWNAIGSDLQEAKQALIDANPSGAKNGLSWYTTEELGGADYAMRKQLFSEIRNNIHNVETKYVNGQKVTEYKELTPEQLATAVEFIELRAKHEHLGIAEYMNKRYQNGRLFGSTEEFYAKTLAQGETIENKNGGMYPGVVRDTWRKDGMYIKGVIYAAQNADFGTLIHELSHGFREELTGEELAQAEAAFDVQDGDWSAPSKYKYPNGKPMSKEEAFAYFGQDYFITGKAPTPQMENVFKRLAKYLAEALSRLSKHLEFSPEIAKVFNNLLADDNSVYNKALMQAKEDEREYRAGLKRKAEEAQEAKKAAEEQAKKQAEAEREEASEGTDFVENLQKDTVEQAENRLNEVTNETEKTNNAIDDALENTNLTDDQKTEIAETLKDESSTVVDKAEATTEAASSAYDEDEIPDELFFQLAGEPSIRRMAEENERERILADLEAAQLLNDRYKSMDAKAKASRIRMMTGWEKDATGAWKYELDDSINRIKTEVLKNNPDILRGTSPILLNLGDILDAPELYKVFPYLKSVRVNFYSDPNAFRAVLTPKGIMVNTRYLDGMNGEKGLKGVLAHEIQHVIQAMEFAESKGIQGENIEQLYNDMMAAMQAAGEQKYDYDLTSLQNGLDAYMKDAGEIEARNVARRILMNADQRRMNTLASTEDVKRNILFQNELSDDELNKIISDIKHTESRQQYIDEYYNNRKEDYEIREYTSSDGKLKGKIEVYKNRDENKVNDIDDALFFVNKGIEVTLLPEGEKKGKKNIDALFNHSALVKFKQVKSTIAKNIAGEVKDSANKGNSEIITVFFTDDATDVDFQEVVNNVVFKRKAGDFEYDYDDLLFVKDGKISRLNKNAVSSIMDTNRTSNITQAGNEVKNYYDPRSSVPTVRGGWNEKKIIKYLKDHPTRYGEKAAIELIKEFETPAELKEHMFYHGSAYGDRELKPSITMSDREIERLGGGGYGQKYWSISVSKSKKVASNFAPMSNSVNIYPIILAKNAKVIEMSEITDSVELEDHIIDLWNQGVDAVWIGDKNSGEQELSILNPRAVVNIGRADRYRNYQLGLESNPLNIKNDEQIKEMFEYAKDYIHKSEYDFGKPRKPLKPLSPDKYNYDDTKPVGERLVDNPNYETELVEYNKKLDEYNANMEEYNKKLEEWPNTEGYNEYYEFDKKRRQNIFFQEAADYQEATEKARELLFQNVYHGSPFNFENFSTENIGTGEGAQAFGWGLYFTNQESIARFYADKLANEPKRISLIAKNEYLKSRKKSLRDVENKEKYEARINKNINHFRKELKQAQKAGDESEIKFYEGLIDDSIKQLDENERLSLIESFKKDIATAEQEIAELKASMKKNRNLYTVEIPDEGYLQWDKTYSKEDIRNILTYAKNKFPEKNLNVDYLMEDLKYPEKQTGEGIYKEISYILGNDKAASLFLKDLGYIGIDYPAHSLSGYTSQDERNYVIFDEANANIKKHLLYQTAYHGSGADFDKFDVENYGLSGEGSMSFGYGVYVTDNKDIARDYANRQKEKILDLRWYPMNDVKRLMDSGKSFEEARQEVIEKYKQYQSEYSNPIKREDYQAKIDMLNNITQEELFSDKAGHLYTLDIPDDRYLDWEKEISKDDVIKIANQFIAYTQKNNIVIDAKKLELPEEWSYDGTITGSNLYNRLELAIDEANTNKTVSHFLNSIGYAGIKYPAGTIHGNGNGAYNYVIFNDDDAKIIDHLFFQTQAELQDEAKTFENWQDFMEYCETFHADDEVSPIPGDADAQWYQTFWEASHGIKTEQEKNKETVAEKKTKEGMLPTVVDALFSTYIRSYPEMIDNFLQAVADIDAIDLDSAEWQQAENEEDAKQREQIEKLKDFIGITLSDYNWQTALKRVQGGHEISEGLRKRLIGEMTDSFKTRDFRALYAEVMNDEQYAVADEDSITASLNKKLKKYHDIVKPTDDISKWSPERRKQLAEQLANKEIAEKIRRGSLKLDDELDAYIKSLNKQIKEKQQQFDELEKETKADYQRIADKERRDLLKLHEQLLLARGKLNSRNTEVSRKIAKGLKITEKYSRMTQNLNADYDELFRKYNDLRNTLEITAEVQAALDRQEQVAGLRDDLNAKQKEKNLTAEVKKMRIQLVKKTMRRVPFNRIDYNNARTVIAIQRMLEPNLLGGVNRFIGIDSPYLRGVISQIVTDSDFKQHIMDYLAHTAKASQAFADFKKKLSELKTIKDFDSWTAKDRKAAIRYLPKENWVRDLNLLQLAKEREESIDLDIGMKEYSKTVYDEKTGEPKTYKDAQGNEHTVTETAFKLDYDDEIGRLVQDAVGADMFDKIVNMPFAEWTTEDLEQLAQRIDELYTEGRDLKAAKDEARKKEAAAIRKRVEDAIKETGITINDDDTPEEKERKQKQIDKILGMSHDIKGTEAAKTKGLKARLNRLLHSYADMNVLRFARMLDGQSEGENVRMLYRMEDDCYNKKQRSMNERAEKVYKIMAENNITEEDLAKTVKWETLTTNTEFTVDELLYFLAADKDYVYDEKKLQKGLVGLDANDDYAATSRNALMFGNVMSDMISQEDKEAWAEMDKNMSEALTNDTLTNEQKQELAAGTLDTTPGTTRYIGMCHAKYGAIIGLAENFLNENPKFKALMDVIEADYAEQYGRMNEVSINEFNQPVHRVKAYVPLVRRESNGDTNENQVREDLLGAAGVGKQWADRGMTKRRVNISPLNQKPVQTGLFRTWADSIERTEHFIAYAPYVRQLNAVYKSRDASYTRRFIESRYGNGAIKYLDEYINEVANPNAGRIRERGAEWLHVLRGKTAPAYLGWKASAIIKQGLTSPWPYMQFVNPAEYFSAAMKFTFNPQMREAIKEKSVFMKMRRMDPVNDLIDEMAENAKTKLDRSWSKFSKIGMQGLELIDWACVAPGWLACYEKKYNQLQNASNARYEAKMAELKERNMYADVGTSEYLSPQQMEATARKEMLEDIETEAVRYADDCTRQCQPSNRVTDLAPMFKNSSEAMKAFLQFQTSLNVIWQNIRYDLPYAVKNKEFTRIAGTVIGYVCAGIFMNSVMDGIGGGDDDDEKQALKNLVYYSTTQFTDSIPIMGGEITNTMDQLITGKRGFYGSGTDMTPSATKLLSVLTTAKKGNWEKAAALTAEGIGLYLGAPVSGAKEVNKLLGKPLSEGDVNLKRGISDVYGIAGDILEE